MNKRMLSTVGWLVSTLVFAQAQAPPQRLSFEVVSVRPMPPNSIGSEDVHGDRFRVSGMSLGVLLQMAFQKPGEGTPLRRIEIVGGPNWMSTDRFDVEAKVDCDGGLLSQAQLAQMMQSLLEDRFQLKAHQEIRELPVYNLVVAKDGPKMKRSDDQVPAPRIERPLPCALQSAANTAPGGLPPKSPLFLPGAPPPPAQLPRGVVASVSSPISATIAGAAIPISDITFTLQQFMGRPIIDKTGLVGLVDFSVSFSREGLPLPAPVPASSASPLPSIFSALQEQGLRLESAKGPVEVVVIDSVQKPEPN